MITYKRGVENVIHFQSHASTFELNYYLYWDIETRVSRYDNLICIGVKKNIFWFVTLNLILLKIKRRDKEIFLHSHNPLMSIMSIYQSNLFTVHDALYYLTTVTKHKLKPFFWLLEKILYARCITVHFISNFAKEMSLYESKKDFVVIPNTSHFETFKNGNLFLSNKFKKFDDGCAMVFMVRSIEERALINLIVAVAQKLNGENIRFLIAGKGPLLDKYSKEINDLGLGNIMLLGYVLDDDLIQYYKDCDLVLVPAAYGEGFGLPIIEGYLFNKPVIASNICAIPEVIISDDFLFENTVESIISKIYFAKEHNYNNNKFSNYYKENYSNEVVFYKINELYRKSF